MLNALKGLLKLVLLVFQVVHLKRVVIWHRQPGVIQHLLGAGSLMRVPMQHREQEV
jgi:hypothetical protein